MENVLPVSFWRSAIKSIAGWFTVMQIRDGARQINRFRFAQLSLSVVFLLSTLFNYISSLSYSFAITISGLGYCFLLQYLNDRGYEKLSRVLFSVFLNLTALLLCYVEGLTSGSYFFYFLVVIISNFIIAKEDYLELRVIFVATFLMLAITFLISPQASVLQQIDTAAGQLNLYVNAVVSFIIAGIFSYHMMKDNFLKERTLTSSQRYLDSVYNTSLDAVFIVNMSNGIVTDCNTQSLGMFGVKLKSEITGKHFNSFFHETSERSVDFLNNVMSDVSLSWKGDMSCVTHNGQSFAGYVSVVSLPHDGVVYKKINILDISDIKQAQAALTLAKEKAEQAVFARTRFVSNMSHELRTPLNGIIGAANLLMQSEGLPAQVPYFDVLKHSSEHMLNLINQVLDFSKIEAGKMDLEKTSFDLQKLVDNLYSLFKGQFEEKKLELQLTFDPQLANRSYTGDPTRLLQVLTNLVSNAHKFTKEGKVILSVMQVAQNSHAATIRFFVQDSGIGIPEEKQKNIFDSFTQVESATTRKFGGTGLGLTISSRIVELYGGKLEVDSKVDQGSCFYFTIQLGIEHNQKKYVNENVVRELKSLKGTRILLAEDNPINMMIAKAVLDKWDITLTEAVNGKDAWEKYNDEDYDILLLDLEMPEMDGFELLQKVREKNSHIPAIAFTAALFENMQAHLINRGFNDYVQKPFRPEDLHAKIAQFVR
ncbi:MAG: response regulator [Chitinophagaceae bacterium]|nr:response regulator [Chitinophagaceae bacterium]